MSQASSPPPQTHLEALRRHLSAVEAENRVMKVQLLSACAASGILADMQQLEQTIALHRPPQVGAGRGWSARDCLFVCGAGVNEFANRSESAFFFLAQRTDSRFF